MGGKSPIPLVLVGAGNMGGSMLRRWIASELLAPSEVVVVDHSMPPVPADVQVVASLSEVDEAFKGETVVLAVKPQQLDTVASDVATLDPTVLVSILAGVTHARLHALFPRAATVRAMPNLPVGYGCGVIAMNASVSLDQRGQISALMAPLGHAEWVEDEELFDAVTALTGCGPAFTFRFIDAMAKAASALGLPPEQATRFATATVEGAAEMLRRSRRSASVLADRVASPGGSTREGLNVLDYENALDDLLAATLAASHKRNRELGG